jgi:hypothetical protein
MKLGLISGQGGDRRLGDIQDVPCFGEAPFPGYRCGGVAPLMGRVVGGRNGGNELKRN